VTDAPAIPTGPIDREPIGFRPTAEMEAILRDTLTEAGVELGVYDERIVRWVAGWDWSTFAVITSWIQRAGREQP
jgi:hypothetical protein